MSRIQIAFFATYYAALYLVVMITHELGHCMAAAIFGAVPTITFDFPFSLVTWADVQGDFQKFVVGLSGGFTAGSIMLIVLRLKPNLNAELRAAILAHVLTQLPYAIFEVIVRDWVLIKHVYRTLALLGIICAIKVSSSQG